MPRRHDLEQFLRQVPIFERLSTDDRRRLADRVQERRFDKGETLFHEGQPSESVWIVREGRIHLVHYQPSGSTQANCVMTVGELFCCLPAMDRGAYPATAVAAVPSSVLQIPTTALHDLMQRSPAILQDTLCTFSSRLRQVEAKGCLVHDPVERRVAQALLVLQKKFGSTIPLTRQEVAELAGTTVETVIRTMSRFQREGWVRSTRGKIQLVAPDRLRRLFQ